MVEIGGRPILWHIMNVYSAHGIRKFIICAGLKAYVIKEYFANYLLHAPDVTFDVARDRMEVRENSAEPWHITGVNEMANMFPCQALPRSPLHRAAVERGWKLPDSYAGYPYQRNVEDMAKIRLRRKFLGDSPAA
jgi:hypothetical protein